MMRLDKYLSHHAGLTRSEARAAVKSAIVTVNGEEIKNPGFKVSLDDEISVLGQDVELTGETYIMLHKPVGFICATEDEEQDTVMDLIPDFDDLGLHIAGRLDKDTTGLVLLSSDGQWTHRVTSPKRECGKVYELETADPIDATLVEKFKLGILLKDSAKPTAPAILEILEPCKARLTLTEGRYHQVKRMFGACGNKVIRLHRSAVGKLHLGDLPAGECRELTEEEVAYFS